MNKTEATIKTPSFASPAGAAGLRLTENQRRVIEDKYLKGAPSIEAWLAAVARNIALAELLYHPSAYQWGLFDGVRVMKKEHTTPHGLSAPSPALLRTWIFHAGLQTASEREANFHRFISNCEAAVAKHLEAREATSRWASNFYEVLSSWRFLPNSPTLMNAGRELQQLSACYVLPVEDSMEGITHALQAQALIHKSGGGTGFSFGRLRPTGDPVKSTEGVASGVVSFMQVFDKMTAVVKQGGNRRGANMGVLPYWHPEIRDFIRLKRKPGMLENFNISVMVDDHFLDCVKNDWEYDLLNPHTHNKQGTIRAREVLDAIVESAWLTGDPGIIFSDRINSSASNPTPALGEIEATNPCGEQPLLPNEPCNLASLNLSAFVVGEPLSGRFDWEALGQAVDVAVRFLDDVIDINNYPLPEIEVLAKGNRRIGLGVMGWAEALVIMGVPYDSEQALARAGEVMEFINKRAAEASEKLAGERGVFPNWRGSIYDPASPHFRGEARALRHCARTTIAPTGTIGLAAGLQGAGIEPFYALAYTRYNARAIDAVKAGRAPEPNDVYFEVNPLFRQVSEQHRFFGLGEKELWEKIERNKKSIRGIPEIPADIQALFATCYDVGPEAHVRMQAAFQAHTDNAVSKTVNLPSNATPADVRRVFLLAHELGCKGITVYRDGSKQQQVLNLLPASRRSRRTPDLSQGVSSEYYEIKTGHGPLHVHIDYDAEGPYRVFASLPPVGTEISGLASIVGVLISKFLEQGGDAVKLLKHLQSVKGDRPLGLGEHKVNSISHAVAIALRNHLKKHNHLEPTEDETGEATIEPTAQPSPAEDPALLELWNLSHVADQCPHCYSSNVTFGAGCSGPVCRDCGHSECS